MIAAAPIAASSYSSASMPAASLQPCSTSAASMPSSETATFPSSTTPQSGARIQPQVVTVRTSFPSSGGYPVTQAAPVSLGSQAIPAGSAAVRKTAETDSTFNANQAPTQTDAPRVIHASSPHSVPRVVQAHSQLDGPRVVQSQPGPPQPVTVRPSAYPVQQSAPEATDVLDRSVETLPPDEAAWIDGMPPYTAPQVNTSPGPYVSAGGLSLLPASRVRKG